MTDVTQPFPKYEIRTLADLAMVPPARRQDCLGELLTWLEVFDVFDVAVKDVGGLIVSPAFIWTDDGVRSVTNVRITFGADPSRPQAQGDGDPGVEHQEPQS